MTSECPELNLANYNEDDVAALNDWAIEADGQICNLRLALIKCLIAGVSDDAVRSEAIYTVTQTYGSERWMTLHGIEKERGDERTNSKN